MFFNNWAVHSLLSKLNRNPHYSTSSPSMSMSNSESVASSKISTISSSILNRYTVSNVLTSRHLRNFPLGMEKAFRSSSLNPSGYAFVIKSTLVSKFFVRKIQAHFDVPMSKRPRRNLSAIIRSTYLSASTLMADNPRGDCSTSKRTFMFSVMGSFVLLA